MKSSNLGTDWRDQWERVVRWHQRATSVRTAPPPDGPAKIRALDELFAYFMNCYHMRDWAIQSHPRSAEVDNFIAGSDAMRLCRDICTGLKHYRGEPRRALADADWSTATKQSVVVTVSFEPPSVATGEKTRWVFITDSGDRDMFKLADECLEAWRIFLNP
jgi:hypothetical protein